MNSRRRKLAERAQGQGSRRPQGSGGQGAGAPGRRGQGAARSAGPDRAAEAREGRSRAAAGGKETGHSRVIGHGPGRRGQHPGAGQGGADRTQAPGLLLVVDQRQLYGGDAERHRAISHPQGRPSWQHRGQRPLVDELKAQPARLCPLVCDDGEKLQGDKCVRIPPRIVERPPIAARSRNPRIIMPSARRPRRACRRRRQRRGVRPRRGPPLRRRRTRRPPARSIFSFRTELPLIAGGSGVVQDAALHAKTGFRFSGAPPARQGSTPWRSRGTAAMPFADANAFFRLR